MFRLKATLVATTLMRPWRTGWPVERGVDFSLPTADRSVTVITVARDEGVAAEPACFIDEDRALPRHAVATTCVTPAATEAVPHSATEHVPEAAGLRAWWSLASKASWP